MWRQRGRERGGGGGGGRDVETEREGEIHTSLVSKLPTLRARTTYMYSKFPHQRP